MPVLGFDHVNIRTTDVARSAKFYVDVFDFEYRQGEAVMGQPSNWLFDPAGRAIIHLRVLEADSQSTGPIDHIALACDGMAEILERLGARGVEYSVFENPIQPITQVFLKDPHGVPLELSFSRT
jgi:catechol 2,3-dioxygenase-like lactoylglutathione lyase family enzyme